MRNTIPLNYGWKFFKGDDPSYALPDYDDSTWVTVDIPHTVKELPLHYFDDQSFAFISWYRYTIPVGLIKGQKYRKVRFEGVATYAQVYANGQLIGSHKGGYTPFECSLDAIAHDESIVLSVRVDASERPEIPPFGNVIDYLTYGGIYREVYLEIFQTARLEDVWVHTSNELSETKHVYVDYLIENNEKVPCSLEIRMLGENDSILHSTWIQVEDRHAKVDFEIRGASLWDMESPVMYTLRTTLLVDSQPADVTSVRFGFRSVKFTEEKVIFNGKKIQLRGLNRHQCYPYVGYAMPASQQIADADLLKFSLGVDIVRTSHYPQHRAFLDRCDEIGLLVFPEIPGWQHIGQSEEWKALVLDHLREMIMRDRNHPSIVLWGVRINESKDDDELYKRTNELAHWLDPTRQTAGVRNFKQSRLYEDVYTYNDFVHRGDNQVLDSPDSVCGGKRYPYMVTEHTGHMFPTKPFDNEQRRLDHALRHARIIDYMYGSSRMCGVIGWCMADYNTHRYFGSGDQVCYHGVTDMFRIPKLAAAVYASQSNRKPVMEVSSHMDIGESSGHHIGNVYVFTNCDRIEVAYNHTVIGTYFPDTLNFPHLPHPPVVISDFIGNRLESEQHFRPKDRKVLKRLLLEASEKGFDLHLRDKLSMVRLMKSYKMGLPEVIRLYETYVGCWDVKDKVWTFMGYSNDRMVCTKEFRSANRSSIELQADTDTLYVKKETYDVVRLTVRAVSEYGITLNYASDPLMITCEGPIRLIGPDLISLNAGNAGIYIRTIGLTGRATVKIASPFLGDTSITLNVE